MLAGFREQQHWGDQDGLGIAPADVLAILKGIDPCVGNQDCVFRRLDHQRFVASEIQPAARFGRGVYDGAANDLNLYAGLGSRHWQHQEQTSEGRPKNKVHAWNRRSGRITAKISKYFARQRILFVRCGGLMRARMSTLAGLCVASSVFAQDTPAKASFEVASVRQCTDKERGGNIDYAPDRLSVTCWPLRRIIQEAYDVFASGAFDPRYPLPETPLEGLPDWADSGRYSFTAKTAGPVTRYMMRGPLMQTLLE